MGGSYSDTSLLFLSSEYGVSAYLLSPESICQSHPYFRDKVLSKWCQSQSVCLGEFISFHIFIYDYFPDLASHLYHSRDLAYHK